MLQTWVTLGNISLVLLNLTKRLVFVMFKLFPPVFTQLTFIFSITVASRLNFCFLAILVWLVSCYVFSMQKSLFTGRMRIALVFAILAIAPLISESLLGNTPVNGNSLKVSGYLFIFLYLVLMFVVSQVNLLHIDICTYPKNDY